MSLLQALVLGVIQGLTEFLPISSTAHLRVVPAFLGWDDPGAAFTAVIQIGTLVAVVAYFWSDIVRLARAWLLGLTAGKPLASPDAKLAWMIAVGTIPIVVCGLTFQKQIKSELRSLYVIAAAAIALALVLMLAEGWLKRRLRQGQAPRTMPVLNWTDALVVGLAQALALLPGASRSGVTITACLFRGMERSTAARFSFLLSLPAILAAGAYERYKDRAELLATREHMLALLIATAVSGVVGYASIAFLLSYLKNHTTWLFIAYRLVLGGLILVLLVLGNLQS